MRKSNDMTSLNHDTQEHITTETDNQVHRTLSCQGIQESKQEYHAISQNSIVDSEAATHLLNTDQTTLSQAHFNE